MQHFSLGNLEADPSSISVQVGHCPAHCFACLHAPRWRLSCALLRRPHAILCAQAHDIGNHRGLHFTERAMRCGTASVDFEASMAEERAKNALRNLQEQTSFLRVLGSYPKDVSKF